MRGELTASQLKRALGAALELAELREVGEFPHRTARMLRQLIPCDHAGYNEIDLGSGRATVVADPADVVFDGGPELLGRLGHQSPIIARAQQGEREVMRLSDFISQRALHTTELYQDVYRLISLEYQLAVQLPVVGRALGRPGEIVGLSLVRSRDDFTESERLLLSVMSGHFAATLERLRELALMRALTTGDCAERGRWVVLIDHRDDTVAWSSPAATEALRLATGDRLPAVLRMWVHGERTLGRQTVTETKARFRGAMSLCVLDGHQLRASLVPDVYPGLDALHLCIDAAPSVDSLCALGLTRRQAEVHELALKGLTSQQIADRLCLSRRTVEKHFEAIYQRLGVSNRAQAVAGTLSALQAVA